MDINDHIAFQPNEYHRFELGRITRIPTKRGPVDVVPPNVFVLIDGVRLDGITEVVIHAGGILVMSRDFTRGLVTSRRCQVEVLAESPLSPIWEYVLEDVAFQKTAISDENYLYIWDGTQHPGVQRHLSQVFDPHGRDG